MEQQQVETLFNEALKRMPAQREAWLTEVCAGDEALLREVTRLVARHELPTIDASTDATSVQRNDEAGRLQPGHRLGPYEIVSFLAAGGMGAVYRASDPRTGRDVAIKVSPKRWSKRFSDEVRAVAALNHPNVCTLYDVGPDWP